MAAYYNEIDKFAAAWLRELIREGAIADGEVDERSIVDVRPVDLRGFKQCHFFAGIGGWSLALRLACWPDDREIWTGSCPCQPFSSAARGRNRRHTDDRHLWPRWGRLIAARRPATVFGEQTAQAGDWLDVVCDDLEALGYAIGAAVLPACSVGLDHARQRIYFVGHADSESQPGGAVDEQVARMSRDRSDARSVVSSYGVPAVMAGFGNAIVPQVAAEFVAAYMETQR